MTWALRARAAAFEGRQLMMATTEHVAFRRSRRDLGDVLRAYGAFHRRRAARVSWGMTDLHTVIITAHNHARYLPEAMDSILRQDWRPLEIVLIDDGSEDDTPSLSPRLLAKLPAGVNARALRNDRSLGQTASINMAALAARGSVLTMADADDFMLGGTITLARSLLARHRAFLFGGAPRMFWGDELPTQRDVETPEGGAPVTAYTPERVIAQPTQMNISHTGSTFLRSAWWLVGGYRRIARTRITLASDREYHLRIASLLPAVETSLDVSHWRMGSSTLRGGYR